MTAWKPITTTGSPITDALIPAAMQLVGAVRDGDEEAVEEAWAAAEAACDRPDWARLFTYVLAAMVPDNDSPSVLLAWCQKDRTPEYRPLRVAGEEHPRAKLTAADVASIRAAYDPRERRCVRRLAEEYGVTPQCVYKILRFENRKAG